MPLESLLNRVIIFSGHFNFGGAEKNLLMLINYLGQKNISYMWYCLGPGKRSNSENMNAAKPLGTDRALHAILKIFIICRRDRKGIVYGSIAHINMVLSILKFSRLISNKVIVRESSIPSLRNKKSHTLKRLVCWFVYRYCMKSVDLIIVQSKVMQADLVSIFKIPHSKIKLIRNPVVSDFKLRHHEHTLTIANDCENYFFIGRLEEEKGSERLLELASKLGESEILHIIGSGSQLKVINDYVDKMFLGDRVKVYGYVPSPISNISLQQRGRLIILSDYEGFPNVALEAILHNWSIFAVEACSGLNDWEEFSEIVNFSPTVDNMLTKLRTVTTANEVYEEQKK